MHQAVERLNHMKTQTSNFDLQLYFRDIREIGLLTVEEERTLGWRIINDNDQQAKQELITANLRLVVYIARGYSNRGLPLADLIEEGNVGLVRAAESFDPARGVRFSSYASWWIKQAISRTLDDALNIVRIPAHMREVMASCRTASQRLEASLGRTPTLQELSEETGKSMTSVTVARRARRLFRTSQRAEHEVSRGRTEAFDHIEDQSSRDPDEEVARSDELQMLRSLLNSLDERSARVLRMRYGLDGRPRLTLRQVSDEVGLTRERVRQIESDSLRRLRIMFRDGVRGARNGTRPEPQRCSA
jgi:RNA polymerase primary sigma factor